MHTTSETKYHLIVTRNRGNFDLYFHVTKEEVIDQIAGHLNGGDYSFKDFTILMAGPELADGAHRLFFDQAIDIVAEMRAKEKLAEERFRANQEELRKQNQEQLDRSTYERLKKKFEKQDREVLNNLDPKRLP